MPAKPHNSSYNGVALLMHLLVGALHFHKSQCFQPLKHTTKSSNRAKWPALEVQAEETPATTALSQITDVSFTLPPFLKEDDTNHDADTTIIGSYPSPLHTVHVKSILSDDETASCLKLATDYATVTGCWEQPDMERHSTYSTCDFPVEENEDLASYLADINFDERLKSILQEMYGIEPDFMSYLDFFCAHYQAQEDDTEGEEGIITTMDRLEAHRDGSLLSFTILLNAPTEFEGGGTFFDGLRDVVPSTDEERKILSKGGVIRPTRAGDGTFHSGKLLHGADVVTAGSRTVLVGFVDVAPWVQRPGVLSDACRDWGRMDVATYLHKRQLAKTKDGLLSGWNLNNARWIHSSEDRGRSALKGFTPVLKSLTRRADPEYQRMKKLEAEDQLLRTILVDEDEMEGFSDLLGEDVTVL